MFLILAVFGLFSFLVWWRNTKMYWKERKVPYLKPLPLIGNLNFILTKNTSEWLIETYRKYRNAPYIGFWFLWKPAILINSPALAQRILVEDFDVFPNRFMSGGKNDVIGSMNLVMVDEPYWSPLRKYLSPVFNSTNLRKHQKAINSKSVSLVNRIKMEIKNNNFIELRSLFSDFSTDVVSLVLFGIDSNGLLGGKTPLREATKEFNKFDKYRATEWGFLVLFPYLSRAFGSNFFPKAAITYLEQLLDVFLNQRRQHSTTGNPNDLLDALMKIKEKNILEGEEAATEVMIAQAVVFLEAGFESIALTLTHTVYELAYSPQVQDVLYQELSKDTCEHDNNEIAPDLNYLKCVIKESLRKCPPLGWLDRVASKDYQLDNDLIIPAGTPVYINIAGIQSDSNFYPDPEKFDPTRFLNENTKKILSFLAFGDGPRNCIGYKFAYQAVYYAVASIVKNFEIQPISSVLPEKRDFEKRSLVLSPCKNHTVKFVPRNCERRKI